MIDTDTGKEARDQTVVMSDGKISDLAKSDDVAVPASARIVDGRGKYLIPGLWDMHVHTWDYESTYPLYIANVTPRPPRRVDEEDLKFASDRVVFHCGRAERPDIGTTIANLHHSRSLGSKF